MYSGSLWIETVPVRIIKYLHRLVEEFSDPSKNASLSGGDSERENFLSWRLSDIPFCDRVWKGRVSIIRVEMYDTITKMKEMARTKNTPR